MGSAPNAKGRHSLGLVATRLHGSSIARIQPVVSPAPGGGVGEQESRTERDNEVPSVKCCFRHRWISRLDVVVGRPQKQPSCHGVRYGVLSRPSGKERQMVVSPRVKAPHTAGSPRVGTAPRRLYARSRPCSRIRRTRTRYSATPSHRPTQGGTGSACD